MNEPDPMDETSIARRDPRPEGFGAQREEVWTGFRTDPEWLALRAKYDVPLNRTVLMTSATDCSALK